VSAGSRLVARLLAVLAVVAAAGAIIIIVSTSGGSSEGSGSTTTASANSGITTIAGCNPKADQALKNGYYIIKPSENFTTIGERTCLDPSALASLNPDLDQFTLSAGACVNLEPNGCKHLPG
jgi:hypothetical protein